MELYLCQAFTFYDACFKNNRLFLSFQFEMCNTTFSLLIHDCTNTQTVEKIGDKQNNIGSNNHHCKCVFHLKYVCERGKAERGEKEKQRGGERERERMKIWNREKGK